MVNGDVYSGIYFGASLDTNRPAHMLKMVQQMKSVGKGESNGAHEDSFAYVGAGEDHAMSFDFKDVIDLAFEGVPFGTPEKIQNGRLTRVPWNTIS